MDISQKADAILELRHQAERATTRQPNKPSKYDRQAWAIRTKIDTKLADMKDEAFIAKMMDYEG